MTANLAMITTCCIYLFTSIPDGKSIYGPYTLASRLLFTIYLRKSSILAQQDMLLYDIPLEEQQERIHYRVSSLRTIDELEDDVARDLTRFTTPELRMLYELFGIPDVVHPTGNAHYSFGGEEVFLFALTKIALGQPNTYLCDHIFGGDSRRWSYGYRWFLAILTKGSMISWECRGSVGSCRSFLILRVPLSGL